MTVSLANVAMPQQLLSPLATAALVALPRIVMVFLAPSFGGDGVTYSTTATNILQHGCVSLSDPASGLCAPHWGGNQLPGYPAFVALARSLTGGWPLAPLLGQALLAAAAAAYLIRNLGLAGASRGMQIAVTLVLAFSPTLVGWPRMMLTEGLATALSLWMLAALVGSFTDRKLRIVELGSVLLAGCFVRYNFVLFFIPIFVTAVQLHGTRRAVWRAAAALAILAVPLAAWTTRNINAGLSPLPPMAVTSTGNPAPPGVLKWMGTWVRSQYDLPLSVWPLLTENYTGIRPPSNQGEGAIKLLARLVDGGAPPGPTLDREFAALADAIRAERPSEQFVVLPLARAAALWLSPFPSLGLPSEVTGDARDDMRAALARWDWKEVLAISNQNLPQVVVKAVTGAWRYAVLIVLALVSARSFLRGARDADATNPILLHGIVLSIVFTVVIAWSPFIETRYLVPVFAWLEVAVALEVSRRIGVQAVPEMVAA